MQATKLLFAGCLALGCVVAGVVLFHAPTERTSAPAPSTLAVALAPVPDRPPESPPPLGVTTLEAPAAVPTASAPESPLPPDHAPPAVKPQPATTAIQPVPKPKKEVLDPMAREALSFVGADPDAEIYWYGAINDPNLSAHERQDLIEDLNEDGFSDPRRPGPEDLPLIMSRLALIEEVAPYAMDQVNADAFQEAYKDLVNMFARLAPR